MKELREKRLDYNLEFFSFLSRTKDRETIDNFNKFKSGDIEFYNNVWVNKKEK